MQTLLAEITRLHQNWNCRHVEMQKIWICNMNSVRDRLMITKIRLGFRIQCPQFLQRIGFRTRILTIKRQKGTQESKKDKRGTFTNLEWTLRRTRRFDLWENGRSLDLGERWFYLELGSVFLVNGKFLNKALSFYPISKKYTCFKILQISHYIF